MSKLPYRNERGDHHVDFGGLGVNVPEPRQVHQRQRSRVRQEVGPAAVDRECVARCTVSHFIEAPEVWQPNLEDALRQVAVIDLALVQHTDLKT